MVYRDYIKRLFLTLFCASMICFVVIKEGEANWQYSWAWDVRNMEGEEVARGIYLWIVTNSAGERRTGKIAIIK